jgi:hypothetical protein
MKANHPVLKLVLSAIFLLVALAFVYRSFYGMRIRSGKPREVSQQAFEMEPNEPAVHVPGASAGN